MLGVRLTPAGDIISIRTRHINLFIHFSVCSIDDISDHGERGHCFRVYSICSPPLYLDFVLSSVFK